MDRLRLGVIGLGIMGRQYVEICSTHPFSRVVAVSDLRAERRDEICQRHGIAHGYAEYREMLDRTDLDGVIVATPDTMHFEPVKDALESGRPVHCEKPFTTIVAEADALMEIEKRTGKRIQVSYNNRWLAPNHEAHAAIARGDIGKPLSGYARKSTPISMPTQALPWAGGSTPAWFLSSHDIDLVRWFINDEPVEARAWGRKEVLAARGIPTYDTIQAQVRFASGAFVTFESGWVYPSTFPTSPDSFLEIIGTEGVIHLDRKREGMEIATHERYRYPKSLVACSIFGRQRGAFPFCVEHFIAMVADHAEPLVTSLDGRQVTATLSAIHKSLETDGTEKISPLAARAVDSPPKS